jgi:hypothetical protein
MSDSSGTINVPAGMLGAVGCVCGDDGMAQTVTLSWPGNSNVVFQGSVLGQPLAMADGQMTAELAYSEESYEISATSMVDGQSVPFLAPTMQSPAPGVVMIIMESQQPQLAPRWSAAVVVTLYSTAVDAEQILSVNPSATRTETVPWSRIEQTQTEPAIDDALPRLEFHATTYYSGPNPKVGDKHTFLWPSTTSNTLTYAGTAWSLAGSLVLKEPMSIGGYLYFFINLNQCVHPGMQNAQLVLSTSCGYVFAPPNKFSPDWVGHLSDSPYGLTRVTS